MQPKVNYQKILDKELTEISEKKILPSLLLHSCCAPCSSYVLEYLSKYFRITIYFYNPNIHPEEEYFQRRDENKDFIAKLPVENKVEFREGEYKPADFFALTKGLEKEREGGERCFKCYEQRMRSTVEMAKKEGFDYFTTVLSISPHKNAQKINEIGERLEKESGVKFLYADFKKKGGFKRSTELSKEYNLYRQDYCGCVFSRREE